MPSKITKDNAMVFSGRLMTLRKNKKISQKQAAKDLGISQALLSHYENGVRECGLNFVVRAAKEARKMVTKYGMSENIGVICYDDNDDEVFIGGKPI